MRKFEKISEKEFEKVLKEKCEYSDINFNSLLKSMSGKGLFQGRVSEKWLIEKGFTKKAI